MMRYDDYVRAIGTIISNFRNGELEVKLDEEHVEKWLSQFGDERYFVAKETFSFLSRNYYITDKINEFITWILDELTTDERISSYQLLLVQKKGDSQKYLCQKFNAACINKFTEPCVIYENKSVVENGNYVYIDDGLYSGKTVRDDIRGIASKMQHCKLHLFYMIGYSAGIEYVQEQLASILSKNDIELIWHVKKVLYNMRDFTEESIDFLCPHSDIGKEEKISEYQKKLQKLKDCEPLYIEETELDKVGIGSSKEAYKQLTDIFLRKGIELHNLKKTVAMHPLGYSLRPSFGFGSVCITDLNSPNNCPLVLWWGSNKADASAPYSYWYPLLPRRRSAEEFRIIEEYEKHYALEFYIDKLRTVYFLAEERAKQVQSREPKDPREIWKDFDPFEIPKQRKKSDLLQYLSSLEFDDIKLIQTIMYIGRDYPLFLFSEEALDIELEKMSYNPDYQMEEPIVNVDNPNELVMSWLYSLDYNKGWNNRDIEVNTVYEKVPLGKYLFRAFRILGIKELIFNRNE